MSFGRQEGREKVAYDRNRDLETAFAKADIGNFRRLAGHEGSSKEERQGKAANGREFI
jgi:hypothetical protein